MAQKGERYTFTSMKVDEILWRWQWRLDERTRKHEPHLIVPACTNSACKQSPLRDISTAEYRTKYICESCGLEYCDINHPELIKEMIEYQYK